MKIKGQLSDMLVQMDAETYADYVVQEDNTALLFYEKLRQDLEEIGFRVNTYDPFVANRIGNNRL